MKLLILVSCLLSAVCCSADGQLMQVSGRSGLLAGRGGGCDFQRPHWIALGWAESGFWGKGSLLGLDAPARHLDGTKGLRMKKNAPCRQVLYAQKIRAALIEKLGGKCALCQTTDNLQFDHIEGALYQHNKMSYCARMIRYRREAELGLLRLLCKPCNLKERKANDNGQWIPTAHASLVSLTKDMPF
jgi:hypothetical protein